MKTIFGVQNTKYNLLQILNNIFKIKYFKYDLPKKKTIF